MFPSKLPISTGRRPTHPTDGTTSFLGSLNRPSNIPLTVKKANLFTPQTARKRPTSSFGLSTGGKSSFANTDKKYSSQPTKQAPDKDQQMKMFENLVEFLRFNAPGMPPLDPKRFFMSISTSESTKIFECLLRSILPDFKINRLEIDVPEALNVIEYPFIRSVTKSSLVSTTTRQAVVNLLSIFQWLITQVNILNDERDIQLNDDDSMESRVCKMILSTDPQRLEEANEQYLNNYYPKKDLDTIKAQIELAIKERDETAQELEEIEELPRVISALQDDIKKAEKFLEEMLDHIRIKCEPDLNNARQEREQFTIDKENLEADIVRYERLVREHEIDESEVEQISRLSEESNRQLNTITERINKARDMLKEYKELDEKKVSRRENLKSKHLEMLKKELSLYESPPYFNETPIWVERRNQLSDFINKFQMLHADEWVYKLDLFRKQTALSFPNLIKELNDGDADLQKQMEDADQAIEQLKENLNHLENQKNQKKKEKEAIELETVVSDAKFARQLSAMDDEIEKLTKLRQKEVEELRDAMDHEKTLLEKDKLEYNESDERDKKLLDITRENIENEMRLKLTDAQTLRDQAFEEYNISEDNLRLLRGARFQKLMKKLSDHQIISIQ